MSVENDATPAPLSHERRWLVYAAVVALLAWYFVSALSAVAGKCTTFDELFHLTAGYSYWTLGDFRLQPENGNLSQRWAAIPLLFRDTHFPNLDQDYWRLSAQAAIGDQFFYEVGNDADAMLLRGRAMIALFGVALGALVFFWTRSLLGVAPALLSLGLYAFCPTVLTQGALVTSDMPAALFFFASMLCIWRVLHHVNWRTLLIGSLVMSGLFVAKFSAMLIVPMGLMLMAIQLMSRQPTQITLFGKQWDVHRRLGRLPVHLATIAVHALVVWVVIWAFYNFRYDMLATKTPPVDDAGKMAVVDQPQVPWDKLVDPSKAVGRLILSVRDAHVLPEAYVYGIAFTWESAQQRRAFLNGKYGVYGWPQFFPYCLLVKTPLTLFVLMGLAVAWLVRNWFKAGETWRSRGNAMLGSLYRTAPLWTLFIVYWVFAVTSHLNIGHRHILPTYPGMFMLAGGSWFWLARRGRRESTVADSDSRRESVASRATRWLTMRRWPKVASLVLLSVTLFAAESLWRWPNYLAYFNQLVGGPWYAYRHLVDSSLDWGQDLPALKKWLANGGLDAAPYKKTYLSYFGTGSPTYYGIDATLLPCYFERTSPQVPELLEAGTYCISATMLQNLCTTFPGQWNRQYEDTYQQLASNVRSFTEKDLAGRNQLIVDQGQQYWADLFTQYEQARLARLTSFLQRRKPDAEINYSILIYRLGVSDIIRAVDGPPVELPRADNDAAEPSVEKSLGEQ